MFANRISSSTSCSICLPETSPPSSSRGVLRRRFQTCNTSAMKGRLECLRPLYVGNEISRVSFSFPHRPHACYNGSIRPFLVDAQLHPSNAGRPLERRMLSVLDRVLLLHRSASTAFASDRTTAESSTGGDRSGSGRCGAGTWDLEQFQHNDIDHNHESVTRLLLLNGGRLFYQQNAEPEY